MDPIFSGAVAEERSVYQDKDSVMDMLLLEIMEMRNYVSVLQGILSFKKLHHLIDVGLTIEMQQFFIAILLVA